MPFWDIRKKLYGRIFPLYKDIKIIFSLTYQNKKIVVCFFQHIIHLLAL